MKPSRRALAGAALAAPAAACATVLDIQASLDWTVEAHIKAIQARDIDALAATLTSGGTLILILPDGALSTTKADYLAFHRTWFATDNWRMTFQPQWTRQSTTVGLALFRTHYEEGASARGDNHLLLTFEREASGWKLLAEQNTRIPSHA